MQTFISSSTETRFQTKNCSLCALMQTAIFTVHFAAVCEKNLKKSNQFTRYDCCVSQLITTPNTG